MQSRNRGGRCCFPGKAPSKSSQGRREAKFPAALAYKELWMVEDMFRTMKSILDTRPIYHKRDETIRGHVFCSFLALLLRRALEQRLEKKGETWEWAEIIRGLDNLQEVEALFQGKRFVLRSQVLGQAHQAFMAAGVALPPTLREKA